ncbi:MAG: hypothetical protein E7363_00065 [Clostridiales bacterium]|nr:hypothetical protein [Clostridiales bacterium]
MRFSVGYSTRETDAFLSELIVCKEHIHEVYMSWGDMPSGRSEGAQARTLTEWERYQKQTDDLCRLSAAGVPINLLFNANCYGEQTLSRDFYTRVGDTVAYVASASHLRSVTTTSPVIAKFIKQNFPSIDVRASVNMGIGSVQAMKYVTSSFDSFYIKRELNRNIRALREIRAFCDENGKQMYLLANSGCLAECPAHTFHDNLVAHERAAMRMDNAYAFEGLCREYLGQPNRRDAFVKDTTFIRPEDVHFYEDLTPAMKLATRVSDCPLTILRAYVRGRFSGNLLTLLEPNHAMLLSPWILDNRRISSQMQQEQLTYFAEDAFIRPQEDCLC